MSPERQTPYQVWETSENDTFPRLRGGGGGAFSLSGLNYSLHQKVAIMDKCPNVSLIRSVHLGWFDFRKLLLAWVSDNRVTPSKIANGTSKEHCITNFGIYNTTTCCAGVRGVRWRILSCLTIQTDSVNIERQKAHPIFSPMSSVIVPCVALVGGCTIDHHPICSPHCLPGKALGGKQSTRNLTISKWRALWNHGHLFFLRSDFNLK